MTGGPSIATDRDFERHKCAPVQVQWVGPTTAQVRFCDGDDRADMMFRERTRVEAERHVREWMVEEGLAQYAPLVVATLQLHPVTEEIRHMALWGTEIAATGELRAGSVSGHITSVTIGPADLHKK